MKTADCFHILSPGKRCKYCRCAFKTCRIYADRGREECSALSSSSWYSSSGSKTEIVLLGPLIIKSPLSIILCFIVKVNTLFQIILESGNGVVYMYQRIRDLREDNGLSQTKIAAMFHMSQQGYSKYETGENDIPTWVLIKLARFYDTSIDFLLGETKETRRYPES